MSYDQSCYDLAKEFLSDEEFDSEKNCAELAQRIQTAIEDFIAELHDQLEPKADPPEAS